MPLTFQEKNLHRKSHLMQGLAGADIMPAGIRSAGVPVRDIAEIIGRRLNLPAVAKSPEEAAGHFSRLARFLLERY